MTYARAQLRRLFRVVNGGTPTADEVNWDGEVSWATPVDLARVDGGYLDRTERTLTRQGLVTGSNSVEENALLLSTRAPIGYVVIVGGRTAFNQGCRGLEPRSSDVLPRFFQYVLWARRADLEALGSGSTFMELGGEALGSLLMPAPPFDVQQRIVAFLDGETSKIDQIVARKQAMLSALSERSTAVLMDRIYGCWNSSKHVPLKRLARKIVRPPAHDAEVVTAYRDGEVTTRSTRRADGYTMADDESRYQAVRTGDLVFHGLDGFAGAVGVANTTGKCSPVYHVCEMAGDNLADFLALQIRALALSGFLELQASSVRQRAVDLRNWDRFGSIPVGYVEPDAQRALAREVRRAERTARVAKETIRRQLALIAAHRRALIVNAVTGETETV